MKRLAIFVEGFTELQFVDKLIEEIAGDKVLIEHKSISGGSTVKRTIETIKASKPSTGQEYFVLLYNCGNDEIVKERIREEHAGLTQKGYSKIIGIRDVRPQFPCLNSCTVPSIGKGTA
jgi:hypothetical protein